jgi:hypothetical protein
MVGLQGFGRARRRWLPIWWGRRTLSADFHSVKLGTNVL